MPLRLKPSMHEEVFWRTRLNAAFRTACGCFLVGLVLQLGNMHVQWTTFPIFAYVMAVTVVGESTFGKGLQDTAGVLVGTVQGIGMGMLVLQVLGSERMTLGISILCISISSFIIVYPKNTLIISKRIALAHSAILYVTASLHKGDMETVYFPLRLAGTTMVGATCGMLALLMPFPHLAMFQVQSQVKLSTRIASERLRIMADAFCINDVVKRSLLNLQARSLAKIGSTLDAEIVSKETDIGWELPGFPEDSENLKHVMKGLKALNKHLVGMELALKEDLGSPAKSLLHGMLKDSLIYLSDWACLALRHASASTRKNLCHMQLVIDEGNEALSSFNEELSASRQKLMYMTTIDVGEKMPAILPDTMGCSGAIEIAGDGKKSFQHLTPASSFLFNLENFVRETQEILSHSCMHSQHKFSEKFENGPKLLYSQLCNNLQICIARGPEGYNGSQPVVGNLCSHCSKSPDLLPEDKQQNSTNLKHFMYGMRSLKASVKVNPEQLKTAFKMSLAMAIGAFLGSWFSRSKGYWADITLALGFTGVSKGGSFKIANLRAQGTVAGSIYGLLVVLATKDFPFLRLVALLPWVVLTSFLRHSKLYGYAGAVSAFTGAIVILARTNKDSTDKDFTVVRIVEAFVGMTSFIMVEVLVLPSRARSIVKTELISGLCRLRDYTAEALSVYSGSRCQNCRNAAICDLKEKDKSLKSLLSRINLLIKEAAEEPQFWFSAFPTNVFSKLMDAQTRMYSSLHYSLCAFEGTTKVYGNVQVPANELHRFFEPAMQVLEEKLIPTLQFLEAALQTSISGGVPQAKAKKAAMVARDELPTMRPSLPELKSLVRNQSTALTPYSLADRGSSRSMHFMEEFEKSFYVVVSEIMRLHTLASGEPCPENVSNSLLLSLGALAFSLDGLQRETSELEKAIQELLQLESPWSLIDLWDSSKSIKL